MHGEHFQAMTNLLFSSSESALGNSNCDHVYTHLYRSELLHIYHITDKCISDIHSYKKLYKA